MRVFTALPQGRWKETGAAAQAAEAAGFDAMMSVELGHDVFAPLAIAALATERVELTTSIAVAFPRSPTVTASQAWDLQANSDGRFVLGLGSQVKGHNERRFGIPWSAPAPRLGDYIGALRAIWRAWETRGRLDYHSEHYTLTLMTPDFSPAPTGLPMPAVTISAVGEAMLRLAGQHCDGVRLHPLCSRHYLEDVCLPNIATGMRRGGRSRANFDLHGGGFVATGADDEAVAAAMDRVRARVAFYGSTRTYLPILALHGLEDMGARLHRMSVAGEWAEMPGLVSDEVVRLFAVCATFDVLAAAIEARHGGAADALDLALPAGTPDGLQRELLADIRRIPHAFRGFASGFETEEPQ
ncbi:MAG: TIGR03617 family F420-dependent LLM class oxidoreductase [Pseudomonadota bacterium]|nr:TIGR03617 family F420-dependent LLM class oxidoreductase [Pseudomonadota bacterium]